MDDKEYQRKMEEHNQEVQARMSGRNDSGTLAGSKGVQQHQANNSGSGGGSCFPSDADVMTPTGWRKISNLSSGDRVIAIDREGRRHSRQVLRVREYRPAPILEVRTSGESVAVTPSHSLLTECGWRRVADLRQGDALLQIAGDHSLQRVTVQSVNATGRFEPVFNLVVESDYTFVVRGCLAHSFSYLRLVRIFAWEAKQRIARMVVGPVRASRRASEA